MGIIDSLSAGYRFVGSKLWLLIIPVALDLFLWLAPRLSVAPLFDRLAAFYRDASALAALPVEMTEMSATMADGLTSLGATSNLWDGLVSLVLFHVPSLMTTAGLPASDRIWPISNGLVAFLLWVGLSLVGLWIGVFYLSLLASVLPMGAAPKPATPASFLWASLRHWLRVVGFIAMTLALILAVYAPASIFASLLALVAPALGLGLASFLGLTTLVLFLFLYFVTPAIILDDLGVWAAVARSLHLVRRSFWSVLGFAVLINVIFAGMGLLLARVATYEPFGTLAAIFLDAYVGVGLSMALLVFYRTRVLAEQGASVMGDIVA